MGRQAWLFAGSKLSGQRTAIVMNLLRSAKLNRHDPHACLSDIPERLPTHPARRLRGRNLLLRAFPDACANWAWGNRAHAGQAFLRPERSRATKRPVPSTDSVNNPPKQRG